MIQFDDQQIESLSREEREMLENLAQRHFVKIPDHSEEERKAREEEQKKMRQHIEERFKLEKENEDYAKQLEAQLDTSGHITTTQYF